MSAGEYDHPMSWCFAYYPREGMRGTFEHLKKSAWGQPENWPAGVRDRVAEWRPSAIACEDCKRRWKERHGG